MKIKEWPEHEKLQKVKDSSQSIGQFLDWLQNERGVVLSEYKRVNSFGDEGLFPVYKPVECWLYEYFGIDSGKIEQEKRQMLGMLRRC